MISTDVQLDDNKKLQNYSLGNHSAFGGRNDSIEVKKCFNGEAFVGT